MHTPSPGLPPLSTLWPQRRLPEIESRHVAPPVSSASERKYYNNMPCPAEMDLLLAPTAIHDGSVSRNYKRFDGIIYITLAQPTKQQTARTRFWRYTTTTARAPTPVGLPGPD